MTKGHSVPIHYFTKVKNVGDQINPWLITNLFGKDPVLASLEEEHVLAAGSLMGIANRRSKIWGTGVLHPSAISGEIAAANICALRGKLSYRAIKDRGIELKDIPLGDPGFLVARKIARFVRNKRHKLGVAAHYVDRMHPWVLELLADPDVVDLNVHAEPEEFLQKVGACEAVVSSSLHGLVFAEALQVPNIWVKLSDRVLGEGFKFRDWFSLAERPQTEPELPYRSSGPAGWIAKARLHDMRIDTDGLLGSFPYTNGTAKPGD